jgi:hypothetical protein
MRGALYRWYWTSVSSTIASEVVLTLFLMDNYITLDNYIRDNHITHDRFGSSSDPILNGQLHYPGHISIGSELLDRI